MKNYKNYLIALLTGLLVLSLSTQQAQSAGTSAAAKAIQYDHCLTEASKLFSGILAYSSALNECVKYKP
jgi:hypothetical protein